LADHSNNTEMHLTETVMWARFNWTQWQDLVDMALNIDIT